MSTEKTLQARSESKCELCSATESLVVYEVPPRSNGSADQCILLCAACCSQIENPEKVDVHHWRCLNESMWSQMPAVQVMAWRMLKRLSAEGWTKKPRPGRKQRAREKARKRQSGISTATAPCLRRATR